MSVWGIKTEPMGDVRGKLRDFSGCEHARTHIQKTWEHNDRKRETDYHGKKRERERHTDTAGRLFQTHTHASTP